MNRLRAEDECSDLTTLLVIHPSRNISDLQIVQKPREIDSTVLYTSHQSVALHVVESIRIKLTRHHRVIEISGSPTSDHLGDIIRETAAQLPIEHFADLSTTDQLVAYVFMVNHLEAKPFSDIFKSVAEHPVSDVVKKCCSKRHLLLVLLKLMMAIRLDVALDDLHEVACCVIGTDAMREAGVRRAGISKL